MSEGNRSKHTETRNTLIEYQGLRSEPMQVEIPVELTPIVYGQAAFGPFGHLTFRTVFVLVNPTRQQLHYQIEFFDRSGQPLDVMFDGQFWDDQSFQALTGGDSIRLRFAGADATRTSVGWARVTSTRPLRGIVLYQLIDTETGALDSEVSLFSSPAGNRLSSFFDKDYNWALALVNPGKTEARVLVNLVDPEQGPDLPVVSKPIILQPGELITAYLVESFFSGQLGDFRVGTLVIEAVTGKVAATVLKTNSIGIAISSLPIVEEKIPVGPVDPNE